MAARTHYSKSYLSLVESGRRAATDDVVGAYERVLGIGGLDEVDRRDFWRLPAWSRLTLRLPAS